MFYQMAGDLDSPPTKYELSRLRSYEVTGRMNNVLMEVLDMATDFLFMLVLFDQAQMISLPGAFQYYKSSYNISPCSGPPAATPITLLRNLGVASAVLIVFNTFMRVLFSGQVWWRNPKDVKGWKEFFIASAGVVVSAVDPWNGSLIINSVMDTEKLERSDYHLAVKERNNDIMLLFLEGVPQFTIQIIYLQATQLLGQTSVAWYVTIFFTVHHMISQGHEIVSLHRLLPRLKELQPGQLAAFSDKVHNMPNA